MIRSIVVHDIPADSVAAMERWYHRVHAPEIVRRYGPWLARHESFVPVPPPPEAAAFGVFNWRVTDGWWRELPEPGPQGALCFTPPPVWPRVATCFIPAQPTEDFLGWGALPEERACFRWHVLQRYPHGVPISEGEGWFLETHAPELCALPGLRRFFSSRVIDDPLRLPGTWADGKEPPPETILPGWHRVSELWFESLGDWRAAVVGSAARLTPSGVGDPAGLSLRGARPRLRQLVPARAPDRRVPARSEGVPAMSSGADVVWDLRVHENVKVLFVRDTTGNLVELVEPLEPAGNERTSRP